MCLSALAVGERIEGAAEAFAEDAGEVCLEDFHGDVPRLVEPRAALSGTAQPMLVAVARTEEAEVAAVAVAVAVARAEVDEDATYRSK